MANRFTPVVGNVYDRIVSSCTTINQVNRVNIAFENRLTPAEVRQLAQHLRTSAGLGLGFSLAVTIRQELEKFLRQAGARLRGRVKAIVRSILRRRSPTGVASPQNRVSSSLTPAQRRRHSAWWGLSLERELVATAASNHNENPGTKDQGEFVPVWRRGDASLFSTDSDVPRRPRGLIICVTGNRRRMMMPLSTWLSNVPSDRHDVLILTCRPGRAFVDGVRGFSRSLPETFDALGKLVAENNYTTVWVVGSSGGTLPALFAGLSLGAHGIFLAGSIDPDQDSWRGFLPHGELERRVGEAVASSPRYPVKIVLAFGVDDEPDALFTERLAGLLPEARLMPVTDATHNCLYPLAQRRQLGGVLRNLVSSPE